MKKYNLCSFFLLYMAICLNLKAQSPKLNPEKEKITNAITNYFQLERETIHLHFDKNIFFSNEEIWFKGYVLDRKNNIPFLNTSNVFIVLLDENGTTLNQQLLYANEGAFSGNLKLGENYKSGTYYVQIYTNWMNNFIEDESSIYKIKIINEKETAFSDSNTPNLSKIKIEFFPEGGSIIEGIKNSIGIKTTDNKGIPIQINEVNIIDSKGEIIRTVKTNTFGDGKFDLTPSNETYKAVLNSNNKTIETALPTALQIGTILEVNNYAFPNKTVIVVKTNEQSLKVTPEKSLSLVVQQDDKFLIFDVKLNAQKLEQQLLLSNDNLFEGVNTIRVIDAEMNQIAERMIFKNSNIQNQNISINPVNKTGGSIIISGKTELKNSNLSTTVLPENSISSNDSRDILGDFLINPYLADTTISNTDYYLKEQTTIKKYELDLFLLNQKKNKYSWTNILNNPPKANFEFDNGLSIRGTVNQDLKVNNDYKVRLYSIATQLSEFSEIDKKNEFNFKNIFVINSTPIYFGLLKKPDLKPVDIKYAAQITNGKRAYNKIYKPKKLDIEIAPETKTAATYETPKFKKEIVNLEEVKVRAAKLKHENDPGLTLNGTLTAHKVTENEKDTDVLDYIHLHGFIVNKNPSTISVVGRRQFQTINAEQNNSPNIYFDGDLMYSLDRLFQLKMGDIDEIYISKMYSRIEMANGVIKLYSKKQISKSTFGVEKSFVVSGGFEMTKDFENDTYETTVGKGFENFGVINWVQTLIPDENGGFKFQIPNLNQKKIKLLIEGFNSEGKLISETKTLSIEY